MIFDALGKIPFQKFTPITTRHISKKKYFQENEGGGNNFKENIQGE